MSHHRTMKPLCLAASALAIAAVPLGAGAQEAKLPSATVANLGQQLVAAFSQSKDPYATPLPDHLWITADDKSVIFLHFDKPIGQATRLLYIGYGIKGRWCAEDQQRAEALAGKGFTHFHRIAKVATPDAGHGGAKAGEAGYWLKHVAVGPPFKMPWGDVVTASADTKFMPTAAPKCGK